MAITQDATSQGQKTAVGTTLDVSHVATGTGTDGLLVVFVAINTSGATTVTGVVWDQGGANTALTQLGTLDAANSAVRGDIWYLKAPSAGTKTIRVTTSAAQATILKAVTFTGVNQTTAMDGFATDDNTTGTASSTDVTSATGNLVVDMTLWEDPLDQSAESPGGGQSLIGTAEEIAGNILGVSCSKEAGASTVTMSWSWTSSVTSAQVAANINALTSTQVNLLSGKFGLLLKGKL